MGDVNGNGWLDAVTANGNSHDVSVLLNAADDAAFFYLDAPAKVQAGQPFDLTHYALSGTGLLAHGYRGTVAFWSSDKAATLPEPYTFQPADGGMVSFPGGLALQTPGLQELYVFDLETFTVIGYATIEVGGGGSPGGAPGERGFLLGLLAVPAGPLELVGQRVFPVERGPAASPGPEVAPPPVPAAIAVPPRSLPRPLPDRLFAAWADPAGMPFRR